MMHLQEVQIELTGICNASCSYCTWQKRTVGKTHLPVSLALRLLRECKDLGVECLRYHGLGESLLHPHLTEVVDCGQLLGLDHWLSTNCYKLTGELAKHLSNTKTLSLILAIPWVMHDRFVEVCIQNALDYLALPYQNRILHVQMVCHEGAQHHYHRCIDTFLPFIERCPRAFLHLKQPLTWPNDTPNIGFMNLDLQHHPKVILDRKPTPLSIGWDCTMPNRLLMVLADGSCVPCCVGMDDWGLGRVQDRSLKEIWESPRMEEIRRLWQGKDDSLPCGHCLKRTDCRHAI